MKYVLGTLAITYAIGAFLTNNPDGSPKWWFYRCAFVAFIIGYAIVDAIEKKKKQQ